MKMKRWCLPVLAIVLVLCAAIGGANAYFTTHTQAIGGHTLHLGHREELTERLSQWTKRLTITSDPDGEPVFVRARGFCGSKYQLVYLPSEGWSEQMPDGFCYYGPILYGGESTTELLIRIDGIPEDALEGDSFNVTVIYESTPVLYREDGTPYADWDAVLDRGEG